MPGTVPGHLMSLIIQQSWEVNTITDFHFANKETKAWSLPRWRRLDVTTGSLTIDLAQTIKPSFLKESIKGGTR